MKLIVDVPEELTKKDHFYTEKEKWSIVDAVQNGVSLDKLRIELEDYITHSPYIKSFIDCCRLRDDVMRIIDRYRNEVNE